MDILYTAKVTATGGRHGSIRRDDGLLDLNLAMPKALGGKGALQIESNSLQGAMLPASRTLCYASAGRLDAGSPTRCRAVLNL
jgi:organic hydroperoxide reductase OsmC/OhrA